MTNNSPKSIALKTLIKHKHYLLNNYVDLQHIIESNQFTIIEYKKHTNSEYISELIKKLNIEREIEQNDSFLYINNNLKLLFLHTDLSDDDKCSLLIHELGHILDPNFFDSEIIYSKIKKEEFANEFSFYLKNPGIGFKLKLFIMKKWRLLVSILLIAICSLFFLFMKNPTPEKPTEPVSNDVTSDITHYELSEDKYYITSAGKKYHKEYCTIIKYKNNLTQVTLSEAIKAGFKPCLVCHPNEE